MAGPELFVIFEFHCIYLKFLVVALFTQFTCLDSNFVKNEFFEWFWHFSVRSKLYWWSLNLSQIFLSAMEIDAMTIKLFLTLSNKRRQKTDNADLSLLVLLFTNINNQYQKKAYFYAHFPCVLGNYLIGTPWKQIHWKYKWPSLFVVFLTEKPQIVSGKCYFLPKLA